MVQYWIYWELLFQLLRLSVHLSVCLDYSTCLSGTQEQAKSNERKQKETTVLKSIDLKGVVYPCTEAHIEDIDLAQLRSKIAEKGHKAKVVLFLSVWWQTESRVRKAQAPKG